MYIGVDLSQRPARVTLEEADDFQRFSVHIAGPRDVDSARGAIARVGTLVDFGEARIDADAVRRLAAGKVAEDWEESFQGLLWHAREAGWIENNSSGIRARCEWSNV
jgi:hypothetical protein